MTDTVPFTMLLVRITKVHEITKWKYRAEFRYV